MRREMLSVALARQVGQVLTPELAKAIVREACSNPDLSIDPGRFAPEHHGGYTFQCERLADAEDELVAQRTRYLYEVSDGAPVLTNWRRLREMQHRAELVIFTARDGAGQMVGSVWLYVGANIDTTRLSVTDDLLYVEPAHRGALVGLHLVQYAERCVFALGVREATFHFRLENGADRMARFLGYTPDGIRVTKTHNGDSFADAPTRHKGVFDEPAA